MLDDKLFSLATATFLIRLLLKILGLSPIVRVLVLFLNNYGWRRESFILFPPLFISNALEFLF